jgi:hypothetical protein
LAITARAATLDRAKDFAAFIPKTFRRARERKSASKLGATGEAKVCLLLRRRVHSFCRRPGGMAKLIRASDRARFLLRHY